RRLPGPLLATFTRLWYCWQIYRGDFEKTSINLHRKYGKIVQIGPNLYSIDDSDAFKTIYGHGSQFTKSDWYAVWTPAAISELGLFTAKNISVHRAERRKMASMYSMSTLVSYEPFVDQCITV
ncbi:hypothetical protein DL98DRAFT_395020, partial [Cadophora sp. DSE1049]